MIVLTVLLVLAAIGMVFAIMGYLLLKSRQKHLTQLDFTPVLREIERLRADLLLESRESRQESAHTTERALAALANTLTASQGQLSQAIGGRQDVLQVAVTDMLKTVDGRFQAFMLQNEQQLSGIRSSVERNLNDLREDNGKRLEQMRATVDERLQKTLETRLGESFKVVSERLDQVYKGLGEMQTLAAGVGDLKKVLSNVKTRGILGEVQLGAILEQILSPEQYHANVATKPGSRNVVEYAVVLPGDGEAQVLLPIDAKFPADAYTQLSDAYDSGDPDAVKEASAQLSSRIKSFAKDIRDKYIDPPHTTDFAILFLPFEGLYAQVLQLGLLETLQREYKVNIAGPTTMAALLNSLQMGFKTLAIQKRSGEVWDVLGAVKNEFGKFGDVLSTTQQRLDQANRELDKLVGVRTRAIQRRLSQVCALPDEDSKRLLPSE